VLLRVLCIADSAMTVMLDVIDCVARVSASRVCG
jgi:hypothetical protein